MRRKLLKVSILILSKLLFLIKFINLFTIKKHMKKEITVCTENNLKEYRKKNKLTQKQVATCLGFKTSERISNWEKGYGVPGLVNLLKLSVLYRATPMQLYETLMDEVEDQVELNRINNYNTILK